MPKIIAKLKEASCLVTRYEKIKMHCRIHVKFIIHPTEIQNSYTLLRQFGSNSDVAIASLIRCSTVKDTCAVDARNFKIIQQLNSFVSIRIILIRFANLHSKKHRLTHKTRRNYDS